MNDKNDLILKREIMDFWEKYSHEYSTGSRTYNRKIKILKDRMEIKYNSLILDIGCGKTIAYDLARQNNIVCLDISEKMLKILKGEINKTCFNGKIHLIRGDANLLPFKDETFDYVISITTFQYIPNLSLLIKEIKRVLKKHGSIGITIPNPTSPYNIFKIIFGNKILYPKRTIGLDRKIIQQLLNEGFRDVEIVRTVFFPSTPKILHHFYSSVEKLLEKIPLVKNLAVSLIIIGRK